MHDRNIELGGASTAMEPHALAVIDSLPMELAVVNSSGVIVAVNRAWRNSGGNGGEVGDNYIEQFAGDNPDVAAAVNEVRSGGRHEFQTERICNDGRGQRKVSIRVTSMTDTPRGASPVGAFVQSSRLLICREDVTDRHEADEAMRQAFRELEERCEQRSEALEQANAELRSRSDEHRESLAALRESNERLRIALRAGLMGTWEIDVETLEVARSDSTDVLFGLKPGGGRTRPMADYFQRMHPDDEEMVGECLRKGIETGAEQYAEYRVLLADGGLRWIASRGQISRDQVSGRAVFAGASMDVTSRRQVEDALRESEERYRLLFGSNPHPMWVYDLETLRIIEVNDAAVRFYGYSHQEFLAMSIHALRPPEDVPGLLAFISRPRPQTDASGVWRHKKKDGTVISVEVISHSIAFGQVRARLVLSTDVTKRLAAEEAVRRVHLELEERVQARTAELARTNDALRESEELFRQLAENVGEVFWMTDICKKQMIYISPAYATTWGRSCASAYESPMSFLEAIMPEDLPRVMANLPLQGVRETMTTYRILAADGMLHWIRDRSFPIRNRAGQVYRVAGIAENITDLKKTEEELSRLASIAESSDDAIIGKSLSGDIISWNSGARRIYGYTAAEVIGRPALLLAPPEDHSSAKALMAKVARGEQISSVETTRMRKNGERLSVSMTLSAVRDAESSIFAISCIERDITERKRLEKEILEIGERERHRIGRDLHDDLGQLLTGISCLSKAVQQELAAKQRSEADDVGQIAELVQQAIGQTRALARGLHPVLASPGGLVSALRELVNQVNAVFRVRCKLVCRRPVVLDDNNVATHLYRIAQEAVNNAIKHGDASTIRLVLEGGRHLTLRIEDDGCGIEPGEVTTGEEPAPCGSTSLPPPERCGMGMRIMSYRARMIGATLSVAAGEERGTVVTCQLPMRIEAAPAASRRVMKSSAGKAP